MRSSVGILCFGWCLTSCKWMTRGQYLPKPSISVSPSVVVPVGENITICCKSEETYLQARFLLCKGKSGSLREVNSQVVERDEAVFHIVRAEPSDAGIYRCIFQSKHQEWSYYSDEVDIKIKEVFYPKLFISVDPKEVVPLGANVSVQCNSTKYQWAKFYLLKEGSPEPTQIKMADWEATVFSISSIKLSDGGIYWCEYRDSPTHASDQVYINITDPNLTKALIQMKPKGQHGLGAKVTIHCEGPENGLTFSLYKSVNMVASKTVNPNRNKTVFSIPTVSQEDAGSYTCRYQSKGNPYVWSEPSMPVQLIVKGYWPFKPFIQLTPSEEISPGSNVTIECEGPYNDLTFLLLKSKQVTASKETGQGRNSTKFHLSRVTSGDAGNYTCHYYGINEFTWSVPSDPVELLLRDNQICHLSVETWIRLGIGLMVLLALVLILAEAVYRWRTK